MSKCKFVVEADLDDPHSVKDIKAASKSRDMTIALHDISYNLPKAVKRSCEENDDLSYEDIVEMYAQGVQDILEENHIDIDDLID